MCSVKVEEAEESEEERICPRCGQKYNWLNEFTTKTGRVYIYAVHVVSWRNGKPKVRKCYLGPKDGYVYVSKMHEKEGLDLRPLTDTERALEYLEEIVDYLNEKGSEEQKKEARALIEKIR